MCRKYFLYSQKANYLSKGNNLSSNIYGRALIGAHNLLFMPKLDCICCLSCKYGKQSFLCTHVTITHCRSFFNRHYLCESLVWTCELSGQSNLTYTQALESEKEAQRQLDSLSSCYQKAVLTLIHHTKRTNLKTLSEEIISFYRHRFIEGEIVEHQQTKAAGLK